MTLRVEVLTNDGSAVLAMSGPVAPENGLQVIGDWMLAALEQRSEGATDYAPRLIAALRERVWRGDEVLADQLDTLLQTGVIAGLRPLPVDLDELAGVLEGDPMYGGGRIDLETGAVWPEEFALDSASDTEYDDVDKWLRVYCDGSRDGYRDMARFIGTVSNPSRADLLEVAISGRGAFRRFKDVLNRWPGELDRWFAYTAERQRGRARDWLAGAGYYVRKGAPPS